jgi:tetratricopeptide (TPR) repeat protein
MKRLLAEYPGTPLNREMLFGFGHGLFQSGRDRNEHDPNLALSRKELLDESAASLERFLAWFPLAPEGDRVSLSLGSDYLEAGKPLLAEATGRLAAARYPRSSSLDTFDYLQAFGLFAQRKFPEAVALCERIETTDYGPNVDPGRLRDQATLMKAQVFHAKGDVDRALESYKKVRASFPDAARSIAFLEREALVVPEVTIAPLAKPAELELDYAGVAEGRLRAYKVDLTMLALKRKGATDAQSVEVAGVKPVLERTFAFEHPNARRRERQRLALDLPQPGAYIVGIKAGDFFASGLVLRSDLTIGVQEEPSGMVRVNAASVATGQFVEGAAVTIFGTDEGRIASDKTDLRGIWEASDVRGIAVVVVEKDGHVAFYRGHAALGLVPQQPNAPAAAPSAGQALDEKLRSNEAEEQNYRSNVVKEQRGVEVSRTKK